MKLRLLVPLSLGVLLTLLITLSLAGQDISAATGVNPQRSSLAAGEIQPDELHLPLVVKYPDLIRFTHGIASGEVTSRDSSPLDPGGPGRRSGTGALLRPQFFVDHHSNDGASRDGW